MELKSKMEWNGKILRILSVFAMAFALLAFSPVTAKAANETGNCGANGNNVTYSYNTETGKLTIFGTGKMKDYDSAAGNKSPFQSQSGIKSVEIQSDVTSVGAEAFKWCNNLNNVTIPDSVTSIGEDAFWNCEQLETVDLSNNTKLTSIGMVRLVGVSYLRRLIYRKIRN